MLPVYVIDLKNQTSTLPQAAHSALRTPVVASQINQCLPDPAGSAGCLLATSNHKELVRLHPTWAAVPRPTIASLMETLVITISLMRSGVYFTRILLDCRMECCQSRAS
jgi:hypothetical protein